MSRIEACALDDPVDDVDVIVGRRDQGSCLASCVCLDPRVGHVGEVLPDGAGDDPVMGLVGVEGAWITGTQESRRGCLPGVGEAVESFQLM